MTKSKHDKLLGAMKPKLDTPRRRAALVEDATAAAKRMLCEELHDLACRAFDMELLRTYKALSDAAKITKDEIDNGLRAAKADKQELEHLRREWHAIAKIVGHSSASSAPLASTVEKRLARADEEIARLKDAWMEITAKAVAYQTAEDDPEHIISYVVPCGPIHRAAGKLGYQMFDGEKHLAEALKEIARLKIEVGGNE